MAFVVSRVVFFAAVGLVLLVPNEAPAKKTYPVCSPARYMIVGEPLLTVEGEQVGDVLVVNANEVAVPGMCDPKAAHLTGTKKGQTKISARWRRCAGLRGKVRLKGRITDECSRFAGTIRAKKFHRKFVAMGSRCGDGIVDAGAGETCEPPATASCDAECHGPANVAPTVSLTSDPGGGTAPLTVTFTAAVFDPDGDSITYAWDFGDGASGTGGSTATHSYATPGTYRATVTVSDGQATDTDLALIDVGTETTSVEIGPAGGSIQLEGFRLDVPQGAFAAAVPLTVLEFPSQANLVDMDLDPARFRAIGPAFRLDGPFHSGAPLPLTLGYEAAAVPSGFDPANLAILDRADPGMEEPTSVAPTFAFVAVPATVHTGSGTVEATIFGPGKFQVVAMAAPLTVVEASGPLALDGSARAAPATPLFRVVIMDSPHDSETAFVNEIIAGLRGAFSTYVLSKGFDAPASQVTVYGRVLPPDQAGMVHPDDPLDIIIDPVKKPLQRQRVVAHEYFHVIQLWNSNDKSSRGQTKSRNAWFLEGSAEWAEDEVFDAVPKEYVAPTGHRFTLPLNRDFVRREDLDGDGENDLNHYRTVAFWKWLETRAQGSIQMLLHDHMLKTHGVVELVSGFRKENTTAALHLDSLKAVHGDLDFLAFVVSALYWKDFDQDETGTGDLWDPSRLGPIAPKDVPAWFRDPKQERIQEFRAGSPGDSESNPKDIPHVLTPHLSADAQVLVNAPDSGLSGVLHLEFEQTYPIEQLAVISRTSGREVRIRDLSHSNTAEMAFSPGDEVVVLSTDPEWGEPETNSKFLTYKGWVEDPCLRNPGTVTPVSTTDELISALKTVGEGNTIQLAPGSYDPPVALWDVPGFPDGNKMNLLAKSVTLDGAGAGAVSINIRPTVNGDPAGLYTYGRVLLKNLTVHMNSPQAYGVPAIWGIDGDLTICSADIRASGYGDGLRFMPWVGGSHSLKVVNSSITTDNIDNYGYANGIEIESCNSEGTSHIQAEIKNTIIQGWREGVTWSTYYIVGCGDTTVSVDCSGISGNKYFNAVEWLDTAPSDTPVEHCPK